MTTDLEGKRAYVMTLRAREQDIRRDKAASNICTNQALLALAASIYVATLGPHGLRDVAALGAARAAELEAALAAVGVPRAPPGSRTSTSSPSRVPGAREVHRRLLDRGVLAGLALADAEPDDPSLADALLVCATEVTTSEEIAAVRGGARRRARRRCRRSSAGRGVAVGDRERPDERRRRAPPADAVRALAGRAAAATRSRTRRRTRSTGSRRRPGGRSAPALPELNEPEVVRHYVNLSQLNYAIDTGFYPLGSCTMKFNPKLNEWAARLPGFATLHPLAPDETAQGTLQLLWELEQILVEVSGMRRRLAPARGRRPWRAVPGS